MEEKRKEEKKKDEKAGIVQNAEGWWAGLTGEFSRISWPNRSQLVKMTIAAIITSGIAAAIIALYDFGLGFTYDLLYGLFA